MVGALDLEQLSSSVGLSYQQSGDIREWLGKVDVKQLSESLELHSNFIDLLKALPQGTPSVKNSVCSSR